MKIPINELLAEDAEKLKLLKIIALLSEKRNEAAYAVGGIVRDALLHRANHDIDIMVVGDAITLASDVAEALGIKTIVKYETFATAMIPYGTYNIEITSARKEEYRADSRKPTVEHTNLQEDLSRRDFTINAMAVDIRPGYWGEFHDLYGGVKDLEIQIIRTPKDPEDTFFDDPLRMMRAVRFAAQLQYRIHPDSFKAIQKMAERLSIISRERIRDELYKIILSNKPSIGLILLKNSGLMDSFLPEFSRLMGVDERDGFGHKDVFYHTAQVVDNICTFTQDPILRFAAMFHDIGKPKTKRFRKGSGWTYHGHEDLGSKMFEEIGHRLRFSLKNIKKICKLIRLHLRPIAIASDGVTDSAVRRLMVEAGEDIQELMILCRSDITSQNKEKVKRFHENFTNVEIRIREVSETDTLRNFQSPVDGNEIMTLFNLKPSPGIGIIKEYIENEILEGHIENNRENVLTWIELNRITLVELIKK
ncbi:HD domain-containing protein [bacterium]|nr:HD domain-containing protein [bacterium]